MVHASDDDVAQPKELAVESNWSEPDSLTKLRSRVEALEAENASLLERYAVQLEADNERMRVATESRAPVTTRVGGRVAPSGVEPESSSYQSGAGSIAAHLARDLVAIEDGLDRMDHMAALGEIREAAVAKVTAATRACSALRRVTSDADFRQLLMTMPKHAAEFGTAPPSPLTETMQFGSFRDLEVQLLELIGLGRTLAESQVDKAIEAYNENPGAAWSRVSHPDALLDGLRTLRQATCQTADILAMGVQRADSRRKWRKIVAYGLGGTVIVAANGLAVTILGPAGVAVSQAVGAAAVGVAVPLVG